MAAQEIKATERFNWPVTILLLLGLFTVLFPLYMTVIIAFKLPSEMTNDVIGLLSFPQTWSLENFREAMRVTDFWRSLFNSFLITAVTVIFSVIIHSLMGYAVARNMNRSKFYRFSYFYIVSGMFVPFAILMMPLVKQTAQLRIDNMFGVIVLYVVFYMPMNVLLYAGYLKNIPIALEEAAHVDGASTWTTYWKIIFPLIMPFFTINMVLCMKNNLMVFDQIMALTKGGPAQSTESISYLIYNNGMAGGQFGFQSANAVVFFIVIVIISVLQLKYLNKKEEQL